MAGERDVLAEALDRMETALEGTEGIPLGLFGLWENVRRAALATPSPECSCATALREPDRPT